MKIWPLDFFVLKSTSNHTSNLQTTKRAEAFAPALEHGRLPYRFPFGFTLTAPPGACSMVARRVPSVLYTSTDPSG